MPTSFDAVFIGADHNTLVAAPHLAARGWRVGVFEQAPVAGGAVKTGEYTLPGFRRDWAAMNLSLFAGSAFFKAYSAELIRHGLEFIRKPIAKRSGQRAPRQPPSAPAPTKSRSSNAAHTCVCKQMRSTGAASRS